MLSLCLDPSGGPEDYLLWVQFQKRGINIFRWIEAFFTPQRASHEPHNPFFSATSGCQAYGDRDAGADYNLV